MKTIFLLGSAWVMLQGCKAQSTQDNSKINKDQNTLLWRITGNGLKKPSYLYGTFHLMCRADIHISDQLRSSIASSDVMYLEMDMDDPATLLGGFMMMNMKNGKKLKDLYSEEEYKKVKDYFNDTLGMPLMLLERTKPYFLVAMLYPKMMNCSSASGVEEVLMQIAKENKKEIKGLETMQFQSSVFDSIPYEWQAKELLKNIDSFKTYKLEFDSMLTMYRDQQLGSMAELLNKDEATSEYEPLLLSDRNKNWVEQLKLLMKKQSVFTAVGAGHLVGEKGLIQLLRKEGYKVEPLVNQ